WITDPDGKATFFNKGWLEFTGRDISEEIDYGWTSVVHPDDRLTVVNSFSEAIAKHSEYLCEYRLRRHDGLYRWVSVKGTPRYLSDGTYAGYVGGCLDVDVQKRFASELEQQV